MGLIDTLFGSDSGKDTKKGVVKMTGVIEGRSKTVEKKTLTPQIKSIEWKNRKGKEISKAKYGKEVSLLIETDEANGCWLFVSIDCDNWEKPLYRLVEVDWITIPSDKCTKVSIIPQFKEIKDKSIEENQIQAEVWVLWHQFNNTELKNRSSDQVYLEKLSQHLKGEDDPLYASAFMFVKSNEKSLKSKELSISKILIVIDPGHGYKNSHQGTQCRGFQYYEKDEKGELDKEKIKTAKASVLPSYVLADIEKWIVKWVDTSVSVKEQEWYYTIQVSLKLKEELELENAYKIIFTREKIDEQIEQIKASDNFPNRRKVGNDNDADYFLSIHCDGEGDKNTAHIGYKHTGFFVILPRDVDTNSQGEDLKLSKELGEDLVKHFDVINHDKKPIWIANGEKGVLTKNNNVQRRLIIELGRMTNPLDIIKLYEKDTQDKIAKQLKDGIVYNINKMV